MTRGNIVSKRGARTRGSLYIRAAAANSCVSRRFAPLYQGELSNSTRPGGLSEAAKARAFNSAAADDLARRAFLRRAARERENQRERSVILLCQFRLDFLREGGRGWVG